MKRHSVSWATTFWLHSRPRSIGLWKSWWVRVPTTLRISPWRLIGFGHWETVLENLFNTEICSIHKYLKSIGHYNSFENTERIPKVVSLFSKDAVLLCFLFRIFSSLKQFNNGQQGVHEPYNPGLLLCLYWSFGSRRLVDQAWSTMINHDKTTERHPKGSSWLNVWSWEERYSLHSPNLANLDSTLKTSSGQLVRATSSSWVNIRFGFNLAFDSLWFEFAIPGCQEKARCPKVSLLESANVLLA